MSCAGLRERPLAPCGGDSEAWPCEAGLSAAKEGFTANGGEVGVDPSPQPCPVTGEGDRITVAFTRRRRIVR
jgi:hypothetical protein